MIAIFAAMKMEEQAVLKALKNTTVKKISGVTVTGGTIMGREVIVCRFGMGMRRAAKAVRLIYDKYKPSAAILAGVSGGLISEIKVSETVISVSSYAASGKACKNGEHYAADPALVARAHEVLPDARVAPIAASIALILNKKRKARLVAKTNAVCIDMESFTFLKAANECGMPAVVVRCISDTVDPQSLLSFFKNGRLAAMHLSVNVATLATKL